MQQLCPGAPRGSRAVGSSYPAVSDSGSHTCGTSGQPHRGVTLCCAQVHTAMDGTARHPFLLFLLLLTDQAQQGNESLTSSRARLSHTRWVSCEGNQKQVMFEPAVPTRLDQAIKTQLCQYRDTQKCPFAPVCAGMCLQHGLSTAWHTEDSLQTRDEGLFFSFPTAN